MNKLDNSFTFQRSKFLPLEIKKGTLKPSKQVKEIIQFRAEVNDRENGNKKINKIKSGSLRGLLKLTNFLPDGLRKREEIELSAPEMCHSSVDVHCGIALL